MRYVIESSQILANWLVKRDAITFKELNEVAREIQGKLPSVCVDVSHYSVGAALEDYPSMFWQKDDVTISKAIDSKEAFEPERLDIRFNQGMPEHIRKTFLESF